MTADRLAEQLRPLSPEEYDACPAPTREQFREARERGRADLILALLRARVASGDVRASVLRECESVAKSTPKT